MNDISMRDQATSHYMGPFVHKGRVASELFE
jgi:hypothetical protein